MVREHTQSVEEKNHFHCDPSTSNWINFQNGKIGKTVSMIYSAEFASNLMIHNNVNLQIYAVIYFNMRVVCSS